MKTLSLLVLLLFSNFSFSQAIEEKISKIYYSNSDTISYKYSKYNKLFQLDLSSNDTISPGTDYSRGIVMTAYIGKDSLQIIGDNFPFARRSYVTIQTPTHKAVVIFRFNANPSDFSQEYIEENDGKIFYEIPQVYELANIIWSLSPSGKRANYLQKDTEYFKSIENYFKPYLNEPIFNKLDFNDEQSSDKYYSFRENSFMYQFKNDSIIKSENYNYVYGNDWDSFTNLFTDLLPLINDFAKKSNYLNFYKNHLDFYKEDIERVEKLLPTKNMWDWLEKEFSQIKYNSYKIIFSPLIGGSHSTQNYSSKNIKTNQWYSETVMFICNSNRYDSQNQLTEEEKKGLMSGVVFTEIDHNYVNRTTSKYKKEIIDVFSKSGFWSDSTSTSYNNPIAIFNEYMTHSVFCLWVIENFDKKTADYVIQKREELNVDKRQFYKFKEFNQYLIKLKAEKPTLKVEELYPDIITWTKKFSTQKE